MIDKITESANQAIDALKSSPVVLAVVILQFLLLAGLAWNSHDRRQLDHEAFQLLLKQCGPREGE